MCLKPPSYSEFSKDDIAMLRFLCNNIYCLMKSGKSSPSSPIKYQKNFGLMIEDALTSNMHLFTDDEKFFLGDFALLPFSFVFMYKIHAVFCLWFVLINCSLLAESFRSFSDDSQRLFVRLYSRKGSLSILTYSNCDM